MTSRRQFIIAGTASAFFPGFALGQRPVRIGILLARPVNQSFYAPPLLDRMAELGYRQGAGMALEARHSETPERFGALAKELVTWRCELVFAVGPEAPVRALQQAHAPAVVFVAVDYDPVEKGVVTSLSRPDRNTTGVYVPQGQLAAKRLEVMRQAFPTARTFLVLSDAFSRDQLPHLQASAQSFGVRLKVVEFSQAPYDIEAAFAPATGDTADAYIGLTSPIFANRSADIGRLLQKYRMPAAGWVSGISAASFLFGYGDDPVRTSRRAAEMGARVLKGAKPAEIPVEQADQYEFVVNARVAREFGFKVPEAVLARATRIVQ